MNVFSPMLGVSVQALSRSASENKVKLDEGMVRDLVELIMEELDIEGQGVVHVRVSLPLLYNSSHNQWPVFSNGICI